MFIICDRSMDTLLKPKKHNMTQLTLELFLWLPADFLESKSLGKEGCTLSAS